MTYLKRSIFNFPFLVLALLSVVLPGSSQGQAGEAEAGVRMDIAFLPVFFHRGEVRDIGVELHNSGAVGVQVECEFTLGSTVRGLKLDLAPGGRRLTAFPVAIPDDGPLPRRGVLTLWTGEGEQRREQSSVEFGIRHNTDGITDLSVRDDVLYDARGCRVVLVAELVPGAEARRWLPVRALKRRLPLLGRPVFFFGARRLFDFVRAGLSDDLDLAVHHIPHDGDPLRACLDVPAPLPSDLPVAVVLAWGLDECRDRYDMDRFARALDTMLDRIKAWNPDVRITVLIPPAAPGRENASAAYAASIRRIALQNQVRIVDWFEPIQSDPDGWRHYRFNDDPALLTELPQANASELVRMLLRKL